MVRLRQEEDWIIDDGSYDNYHCECIICVIMVTINITFVENHGIFYFYVMCF